MYYKDSKPMLAVDCGSVETITFPVMASPKLDGVRALIGYNNVMSRSLKPIPNKHVQALYMGMGLPHGMDGELLSGDPTAPDVYRKTVSMVMSEDAPIDGLTYHLFDYQKEGSFVYRLESVNDAYQALADRSGVTMVPQIIVRTLDELLDLEAKWVGWGYEGVILRAPFSPYKHGRSTVKEGYLLKLKRFVDGEAEVIGVTELMHNANEAITNELGRTARSHKKAGMVPSGVMGTLVARDVKTGVEFEIGTGFTATERAIIWTGWKLYGRAPGLAKYKHFPSGAKDKPRHPVFLGWRDRRDV